jgi:hypothetical protein
LHGFLLFRIGHTQAFIRVSDAARAADKDLPVMPEESLQRLMRDRERVGSKRLAAMRDAMARVMPGNTDFAATIRQSEDAAARMLRLNNGNVNDAVKLLDAGIDSLSGRDAALIFETAAHSRSGLQRALRRKARDELAAFDEVLPGYAEDQGIEERLVWLQNNGIWSNAPDGDGFVLFDPQMQAPIMDSQGQFFRFR